MTIVLVKANIFGKNINDIGYMNMLPDEIDQLQKLLLKFNEDLKTILKPNILNNLNGLTHFNDFITQLNQVIEANKVFLEKDWYMDLFELRKRL